jgi:hypothetical protein
MNEEFTVKDFTIPHKNIGKLTNKKFDFKNYEHFWNGTRITIVTSLAVVAHFRLRWVVAPHSKLVRRLIDGMYL